jgi:hypothetical protein
MSVLPNDYNQTGINNNLRTTVGFVIGKAAKPLVDLWNDYTEWKPWNVVAVGGPVVVDSQSSFYKRVGDIVELLIDIQVFPSVASPTITFEALPFPPSEGMTYAGGVQVTRFYVLPIDLDGIVEIDPAVSTTQFSIREPSAGFPFPSTEPITIRGKVQYRTPTDAPIFLTYLPSE